MESRREADLIFSYRIFTPSFLLGGLHNAIGPELFSKYVGDSEKAVAEVFRKARAAVSIPFVEFQPDNLRA
jgi:hypothetical protein